MRFSSPCLNNWLFCTSSLSVLYTATAQTPQGFTPNVETNLGVTFENVSIKPPGLLVPRSDVLMPPTLTAPINNSESTTYLAFMIDLDISYNNANFTYLHWFIPNLHLTPNNLNLVNDSALIPGATYIPPSPPAGSGPHTYVELLFIQPPAFAVPAKFAAIDPPANLTARIGFNISEFVTAAGLAEPIAGNYFKVVNNTVVSATSSASASGASASAMPSKGHAVGLVELTRDGVWGASAVAVAVVVGLGVGVGGAGVWMV